MNGWKLSAAAGYMMKGTAAASLAIVMAGASAVGAASSCEAVGQNFGRNQTITLAE